MVMGMIEAAYSKRRWFRLTPGWLLFVLLVVEGLLWLSNRLGWPAWHEGFAVLAALATLGVTVLLLLLWFTLALSFPKRFHLSLGAALTLTVAVAVPCGWLSCEVWRAKQEREAVELISALDGIVLGDDLTDEEGLIDLTRWDVQPMTGSFESVPAHDDGLLAKLLGVGFFNSARAVVLEKCDIRDGQPYVSKYRTREGALTILRAVENLPDLRSVDLSDMPIGDADLEHVTQLTSLTVYVRFGVVSSTAASVCVFSSGRSGPLACGG
jgi:hypothetical protein